MSTSLNRKLRTVTGEAALAFLSISLTRVTSHAVDAQSPSASRPYSDEVARILSSYSDGLGTEDLSCALQHLETMKASNDQA